MSLTSVILHGLLLAVLNIASVLSGFIVYHLDRSAPQIGVQIPVAALMTLAGVIAWRTVFFRGLSIRQIRSLVWILLAAVLLAPVVYVPLHYATQGYLMSFGNVESFLAFQVLANGFAMALTEGIFSRTTSS